MMALTVLRDYLHVKFYAMPDGTVQFECPIAMTQEDVAKIAAVVKAREQEMWAYLQREKKAPMGVGAENMCRSTTR